MKTGLHNGINYREVRQYKQANTSIMFYFITRCYDEYMQSILDEFKLDPPHVIIMNSCLWDLHRYGETANAAFIQNISELLDAIDLAVPYEDRLFMWTATLPVRETVKAGFLPPGVDHTLPAEDIRKANLYVRDQLNSYGERFIFLDLHKTFYMRLNLRVKDGVHWNYFAHRKITCFILTEICKHWNVEIPSKSQILHGEMSYGCTMNAIPWPEDVHVGSESSWPDHEIRMNGFTGHFPGGLLGPGHHPVRPAPRIKSPVGPTANVLSGPKVSSPPALMGSRPSDPWLNTLPGGNVPKVLGGDVPQGHKGNATPVPSVNCPPKVKSFNEARPQVQKTNNPLQPRAVRPIVNLPNQTTSPLSNGPLGTNLASDSVQWNAPMRRRGRRNRRGRHRNSTVNPVGPRPSPPQILTNGPPLYQNNNAYLPPRFSLNNTFPSASTGKRKFTEEEFDRPYKLPRKHL